MTLQDLGEWLLAALDCGPPNLRARRIDPHPAWSRDGRRLAVNACIGGPRQLLLAEMGGLLDSRAAESGNAGRVDGSPRITSYGCNACVPPL